MCYYNEQLLAEALSYFKKSPVLTRLLEQFKGKYRALGRTGGTVRLLRLTPEDRRDLGGLLGQDLSAGEAVTVSASQLEEALQQTRFAGLTLQQILAASQGSPLFSRAEEKARAEAEKEKFFYSLTAGRQGGPGCRWIEHILAKGPGSRGIHMAYAHGRDNLALWLGNVLRALDELPREDYERLSVFAARITGDPHGFDPLTDQGRLFVDALRFLQEEEAPRRPLSSEEVSELFAACRLLRDDIFSFVTCTGLLAFRRPGQKLATWDHACREKVILNVPLRELVKIDTLTPAGGKLVFAVENPAVFSGILDAFSEGPYPPLVCTHGQFRLAALMLFDKLARAGARIYYSGDFDPEGLQMARRLLQRYPLNALPWRFDPSDYASSRPSPLLSEARLNKLNGIDHPALAAVKEEIARTGKAGYQEQIIPSLIDDLKRFARSPLAH